MSLLTTWDERMACILNRLPDDAKPRGTSAVLYNEGWSCLWGILIEMGCWNLMRFDKGKCGVLHLGQNNPTYLLDSKLNLSQQDAIEVKKDDCILGGISKNVGRLLREIFFLLYSTLLGLHLDYCVQFWSFQYKKRMFTYWSESS